MLFYWRVFKKYEIIPYQINKLTYSKVLLITSNTLDLRPFMVRHFF